MKSRLTAGVILVLLICALATGCGGSSGAQSSAPPSSSSATTSDTSPKVAPGGSAFIARAEAICARLNTEIEKVRPKNNSRGEIERIVPAHVVAEQATVGELSRLTPPASLASAWRQITGYRKTLASELAALLRAAKANDTAAIKRLSASKAQVHKQLPTAASGAGFKSCGQVG